MKVSRKYSAEDFLGALLLIGALFIFGLFNFQSDEPLVEAGIRAQATAIASESLHGVHAKVEGRDITLTGLVDSAAERDRIATALRAIEGRGRLRVDVDLLEKADPFVISVQRTAQKLRFEGHIPTEAARRQLQSTFGDEVATLTLASGVPDAEWSEAVETGLRALTQLQNGQLKLDGRSLSVAGTALTPNIEGRARLLLEDLPAGYSVASQITVLDDGSPLRLTAARSAGAPAVLKGKLPAALLPDMPAGEFATSPLTPPFEAWGQGLATGLAALEALHAGHLAVIGSSFTLTGAAYSQQSYDFAHEALGRLPQQFQASVDIELVDSGAPFELTLEKGTGPVAAKGKVPKSLAAPVLSALLQRPIDAEQLQVAQISPGDDWWQAATYGIQALAMADSGSLHFDGQQLVLALQLQDPPTQAAVEAGLGPLPASVVLALDVTLIDDGTPLKLTLSKSTQGVEASGKWPEDLTPDTLAERMGQALTTGEVVTTPKPGPADWDSVALLAADVMRLVTSGQLELIGTQMRLTATLRSPAEEEALQALLGALPEGYTLTTDLDFQDDGRPFAFVLRFDGEAGTLTGKVPSDLGPASQAAILGFPVAGEEVSFAGLPADVDWWIAARNAIRALALVKQGRLEMDAHQIRFAATVQDVATAARIKALFDPMHDLFKLNLTIDVIES